MADFKNEWIGDAFFGEIIRYALRMPRSTIGMNNASQTATFTE
jgi:hypothetical protein